MSEEYLVQYCSPTLAGLKTGNLFTCPCGHFGQMQTGIRMLNRMLEKKGLRLLLLRCIKGRALLYLYRPERLRRDLNRPQARALLKRAGYADLRHDRCIGELIRRLRTLHEFPHEIGLFLSYPPEDVRGFIENGGKGCKCSGCWKVYGDEQTARRLFEAYKRCTNIYLRRRAMGVSLDRLAVAEQQTEERMGWI